ncbi:c-type cytochrome biogenesis protein CcsB [Cellulomonas soli]|uniref:C-type cytochrome biogenesis protein CcsB n=1 Tax=Cellulomonas soli TaxID=931535 RepID=A0A512PG62_9CELL|nr:c-type cytochrome biogenesis protein CcsB [Cellulomonas soli]NYI58054.1 cytochrome c-type biogenesis protein CcsB [Cellulomonas soli]GEP70189.1 c-type cytochrome biogenesis protein CcsB [Cellulomonas soli]
MTTGDLSTLLVWGAATAFTIALLAYTVALSAVAEQSARRARGAAVPVGAAASGPTTVRTGSPVVTIDPTDGPGAPVRAPRAEGIARSTTWLGIALLLAGIVLRGVASGRWPTANMYEFTLVGVLVATLVLALVQRRRTVAFLGVVVMGIGVLALALGLLVFFVQADAVQPALQSYWLVLHVGVAIAATGVFTVAFAAAVLQVLSDAREQGRSHLEEPWARADGLRRGLSRWRVTGPAFAWLRQVPSAVQLEALSFRLNSIGFVLWTFTLIGGAIWAEHAWGRYWGWDPKEVGTFVAWVVYAAYLHARTTRGWAGRRAAYIVYVGYAVVIANFTVINLFVTGKHSYSGL